MSGMDEPRKPSPPDRMSAIKDPWSYRDTDGIPRKPVSTNRYSNKAIIYADAAVILIPPLFGILAGPSWLENSRRGGRRAKKFENTSLTSAFACRECSRKLAACGST